jgi:hypothetical protein
MKGKCTSVCENGVVRGRLSRESGASKNPHGPGTPGHCSHRKQRLECWK